MASPPLSLRRLLPSLALLALLTARPAAAAEPLSEAARWLQGYLRIDTTNPPGNEAAAAEYLAGILHREGIATDLLVTPSGRTSLYARLAADRPTGGALLLLHHMDVVPPGPGWGVAPFSGLVQDGRLWGRGAVDIKSLGVAELAAFVDLERRKVPLARDVVFLAVADEEMGGTQGAGWLVAHYPERFAGVEAVLNEGGTCIAANGRIVRWEVEVAQKRPLWLRVSARGRGGHASGLNPGSAAHRLIAGLARLIALPLRYRVTPAARDYFAALAPQESPRWRHALLHPEEVITEDGPKEPLLPGMANHLLDTVQVTVLHAADKINVVAADADAEIDVRLLPDTDEVAFLARLRQALGDDLEVEVLLDSPPSPPSPTTTPMFEVLRRVLGESGPLVPSFAPGFTDSRFFRQRGIAAYGISPFALEPQDKTGIHGPDERIPVAELDRGAERLRRIVDAYVAP